MLKALQQRDALMQSIRAFFHAEGFVEVETPIRLKIPCMELHIDAEPCGDRFLRTSPELFHKKLLAQGAEKIFEIGKCFRQGEQGALHNPEYTMLEWYRANSDYMTALADTEKLIRAISPLNFAGQGCRSLGSMPRDNGASLPLVESLYSESLCSCVERENTRSRIREACPTKTDVSKHWKKWCEKFQGLGKPVVDFSNDWKIFTVAEVFEEFAGWNPVENFDADRFDFDLIEKVEPMLPADCPVVLKDYPAELCALARLKPGNPKVAERWELYLGGVEIANAYSELTDPVEQRTRFEHWGEQRRALGKTVYPIDEEFIQALETMPPSSGVALGVDRLLMILLGAKTLDAVLPFRG